MIIDLSIAVIAIAFAALCLYAIKTLRSAKTSLDQVNQTVQKLQVEMDDMSKEIKQLIHNTNQVTVDVHQKMKAMDAFFSSAHDVGEAVQVVSSSVKQVSASLSRTFATNSSHAVESNATKVSDTMEWVSIGLKIWGKLQKYRQTDNKPQSE